MKKLIYVLLVLFVLSAVIVSCGGGGGGGGGVAPTTETTTTASNPATTTTNTSSTYFGTKSPTDPKAVNDIVFSDGSATPYTSGLTLTAAQKNAAVAMIFYKGTECSNDGSTRTLGVGLKIDFMVPDWCKSRTVAAHDNNIDTIQDNVKNGSQNLEKIGAWLTAHSLTDDTGIEDNYHPFHLAKSYGARNGTYTDGWYLPSKAELQKVYDQKITLDAVLILCDVDFSSFGISILNQCFWSSTQSESYDTGAYFLDFRNGTWSDYDKITSVCFSFAIREF